MDEIVDELARDPVWPKPTTCGMRCGRRCCAPTKTICRNALPLSRQKEFKRIKNMVIQEAIRLGELRQVFHPEDQAEDTLPEQKGADGPQPGPESVWDERSNDSGEPHNSWEQIYRRARAILEDPKATAGTDGPGGGAADQGGGAWKLLRRFYVGKVVSLGDNTAPRSRRRCPMAGTCGPWVEISTLNIALGNCSSRERRFSRMQMGPSAG